MARYFFHYRDGAEHIDRDGVELPGAGAAKLLALSTSGEAIRDLGAKFWAHPEWQTWVTDESGATLCSFTFSLDRAKAA